MSLMLCIRYVLNVDTVYYHFVKFEITKYIDKTIQIV